MVHRRGRVLAVHRYFWPDSPPYASILSQITKAWVTSGWTVDVLASQPSYKSADQPRRPGTERVGGATVTRLTLSHETGRPVRRILNAVRLGAAILWRSATGGYDAVMVSTMPPVVPGLAARIGTRLSGARLIYHCMDLHPEIGRISGEFANPRVYKALLKLDSQTCGSAARVVVLSRDMERSVRLRPGCSDAHVVVMNNFALPSEEGSQGDCQLPPSEKVRIIFAGNVGRFQALDTVVAAMHQAVSTGCDNIELVVMGTGSFVERLRLEARGPAQEVIRFIPHQSVADAKATIRSCDVGLVSLNPEIYKYAYPSKTLTYLEQGVPLLVVVEGESQLANEIRREGIGWTSSPGDVDGLARQLVAISSGRDRLSEMGTAAFWYAHREYGHDDILTKWVEMLRGAVERG